MRTATLLVGVLLILCCPTLLAQYMIHTQEGTCAHANHGEGGCISNHSGITVTGGLDVDCVLKQGSVERDSEVYSLPVGGWTTPNTADSSNFNIGVSGNGVYPGSNTWCTRHDNYYYDSTGAPYATQTYPVPKLSCDTYGQ